ncbi:MAG: SDR family oxidoreductase [Myxococcota bacterium]|nr:SDR family oxidoreductase [Myxococcota bacterium]
MAHPWVLILGVSSGFGAAAAKAYAAAGYHVAGVHLDRSSTLQHAKALQARIEAEGQLCVFFNVNAADDTKRGEVISDLRERISGSGGELRVLLHSLAFGSLLPFVPSEDQRALSTKQMTMTLEVMGNSLVWWTRDLVSAGLLGPQSRVFAMTSTGSTSAFHAYGAVGAAKACLESHVRYLAMELAERRITVNAVLAGVTDTPALRKIPGHEELLEAALKRNPSGRLTECEDVAACLVALSGEGTAWLTGNTLRVDGGESVCS